MTNPNAAFEDEQFCKYRRDPLSVSPEWRKYFESSRYQLAEKEDAKIKPAKIISDISKKSDNFFLYPEDIIEPLGSIQSKISDNMEDSIEIPTATSLRTIPVKALDENRRIINKYLLKMKRPKVSFTHILAWSIVRALIRYPQMNDAFLKKEGKPFRIKHKSINIGLAVDITKKDGTRLLLVPNVKNAQTLNFSDFIRAFDNLIYKTRNNKIEIDDLAGTTVTLTNPGMIGTSASSPRLMKGQGLIIATGSIDYPTEYQAVRPELLTTFAISKVVNITNTYDHRIIQGAESAEFLAYMNKLLIGEEHFYDQIFAVLKIPFEPIRWSVDNVILNQFGGYDEREAIEKSAHAVLLINSYRVRGHLLASINPLGFESYYYPELDPAYYGFTIWDLDRIFHADDSWTEKNMALRDIIELLRETYCGQIGVEYMHIQDPVKKEWIKLSLESTRNTIEYGKEEKLNILKKIIEAELFENFLHTKFIGSKRFSLEGSETLIVMLNKIFERSAEEKLHAVILGMPHRGRLNILANLIGKPIEMIFDEFDDKIDPEEYLGSGDVKYHLGYSGEFSTGENNIKVILSPNPSHLELVNPVIEGMVRATDNEIGDSSYTQTLPILIHGDSAFAGQGIVAETLNLSQLEAYKTGGTIHIIVNNQIGFTTTSQAARSSVYATDIGKTIHIPIIHVNGNDPEAVATAASFAFKFRMKFHSDVIIDMLCYRKYGHNEADEPSYTQPLLYKKIKSMQPISRIYLDELIKNNVIPKEESEQLYNDTYRKLSQHFSERKPSDSKLISLTTEIKEKNQKYSDTFVPNEIISQITNSITSFPYGFNLHPKLSGLLKKRKEMVGASNSAIDWAMAEALAFGSILLDGKEIRFTGQDSRRGTFSQRHSVLIDVETEEEYIPLNDISNEQAKLRIFDSPLSEISVLGFEYGYSTITRNSITLWEAQFGDFANGAQPIIDQFISCAEEKWGQTSNLVMLLPHSYDGQGPEHSSARLERFLQLCAEENMFVCNLTTPAQYFHVLRRQALMTAKKPLIIMTPKGLLRHPQAVSAPIDFTGGRFNEIIDAQEVLDNEAVKRVLFCSGKLYYDLYNAKNKQKRNDVAIIRIEQLYPLNFDYIRVLLEKYYNCKESAWVQEEPQNMGAWNYITNKISQIMKDGQYLKYIGRPESAATASGSLKIHTEEQKNIVEEAIG